MLITLPNGKPLRGDLIKAAYFRSTLAAIPCTFEATIRIDDELKKLLAEGQVLTVGSDKFKIIKTAPFRGRAMQGQFGTDVMSITAFLESCHQLAFVRQNPIIKENATLSQIYRAAGATLKTIEGDFAVPRFSCFVGDYPTKHIAQALQEEGGQVKWKNGKLCFVRLQDFFKQKPVMTLPANAFKDLNSGFLERHEVPSFYSVKEDGGVASGNTTKTRAMRYAPLKDTLRLQNMSRCLMRRKEGKVNFDMRLTAGDLIEVQGEKNFVVITAGHAFEQVGAAVNQYTKLWVGDLNG
jgi:hypothetical protein